MTIETHSKKFFERKLPELFEIFDDLSLEARVVGGFVRDYFSIENKFSRDLDIEIDFKNDNDFQKNWNSLSSKILNHKTFKKKVKKLEFNILKISYGEFDIELSPIRIESFNDSNQHTNFKARYFSTLDFNKSYLRRDLTINSMGLAYFQGEFRFLDPGG
jgi:tRNA nucleotidyltransferase/poly(A) polymerase